MVPPRAPRTPRPAPSREDADRREAELDRLAAQLADKERLLREKDTMIADLRQ
ncbi:hypothetical protein [Streptomyces flaveus]|uniref:hypothetical protein n=1 Tax=Streptomyces flaveus TaxID=66370 RepID=UPI003317EBA9